MKKRCILSAGQLRQPILPLTIPFMPDELSQYLKNDTIKKMKLSTNDPRFRGLIFVIGNFGKYSLIIEKVFDFTNDIAIQKIP